MPPRFLPLVCDEGQYILSFLINNASDESRFLGFRTYEDKFGF
jgi:hypothetical protein